MVAARSEVLNEALHEAADLVSAVQDDILTTRLKSARAAQEALWGRSRGTTRLLPPPPPATLANGFGNGYADEEAAFYRADLESPRGYTTPWRGMYSPPREEYPPYLRPFSLPRSPVVSEYGYIPPVQLASSLPAARRSESVPAMPTSAQFLLHTMTPVTVVTPASPSPRKEVDASRAAVISCRMLAEAGRAAAARCADEAARQAERRVYEEMRRSQDVVDVGSERLRAENARLQEELLTAKGERDAALLDLQRRLDAVDTQAQTARRDSTAYKNTLIEKEDEIGALRAASNEGQHTIRLLKEELENEKAQMAIELDKVVALEREVLDLRSSGSDALAQRSYELEAIRREREQIESDLISHKQTQRRKSEETDQAMNTLRSDLLSYKRAMEEKDLAIKDLRSELFSYKRMIEEKDLAIKDLRSDLERTKRMSEEKDQAMSTLRSDLNIFKSMVEEKDKAITNLRQSIREQREEIDMLKTTEALETQAASFKATSPRVSRSLEGVVYDDMGTTREAMVRASIASSLGRDGYVSGVPGGPSYSEHRSGSEYTHRASDAFSMRSGGSRTSQSIAAQVTMLEVDLTADMSPTQTPTLRSGDDFGSVRGSIQSHISVDLLDDDDDVVIDTHHAQHSRLGAAGFGR